MLVIVTLFDPATNRRVEVRDEFNGDGMGAEYMWTEGNYSCDCNRRLDMLRALGEPWDVSDSPCGNTIVMEKLSIPCAACGEHGEDVRYRERTGAPDGFLCDSCNLDVDLNGREPQQF